VPLISIWKFESGRTFARTQTMQICGLRDFQIFGRKSESYSPSKYGGVDALDSCLKNRGGGTYAKTKSCDFAGSQTFRFSAENLNPISGSELEGTCWLTKVERRMVIGTKLNVCPNPAWRGIARRRRFDWA
jgi:hypothetical protein